MRDTMRCPACHGILTRLATSSEPEGIRQDAQCRDCHQRYAVTKAGCIRLQETE